MTADEYARYIYNSYYPQQNLVYYQPQPQQHYYYGADCGEPLSTYSYRIIDLEVMRPSLEHLGLYTLGPLSR